MNLRNRGERHIILSLGNKHGRHNILNLGNRCRKCIVLNLGQYYSLGNLISWWGQILCSLLNLLDLVKVLLVSCWE